MTDDRDLPIHASFLASVASPRVQDLLTDAADFTLDAITAYAEDVRAGRQIKGGIPIKS